MHNHLPSIDPGRSHGGRHRRFEREHETMRRRHREHLAEERARRAGEQPPAVGLAERVFFGPAAAFMSMVGLRR